MWHPDGTSLCSPSSPAAELSLSKEIEQEVASTTGKVARQFQESQLHLQLERWPVLEEERERESRQQQERERESAYVCVFVHECVCVCEREREWKRERERERHRIVYSPRPRPHRQVSVLSALLPIHKFKQRDEFQVSFLYDRPYCSLAAQCRGSGLFLGYATGDSKREAEDTNTAERLPDRQQDSFVTRDRGLRFPQHSKKKQVRQLHHSVFLHQGHNSENHIAS